MALENDDIIPLYRGSDQSNRKITVGSLVTFANGDVVKLDDAGTKQVIKSAGLGISDGTSEVISLNADGTLALTGKGSSAATESGDADATLTTKGYVDASITANAPVTKLVAGSGIEINPATGLGEVTVSSTVSSLDFAGPVDLTSSIVPAAVRSAGSLYVNTGTGKFSPEWAAVTKNADITTDANPGDFVMKDLEDQASDPWTFTSSGIEPGTLLWSQQGTLLFPIDTSVDVLVGGSDATSATIQLKATGTVTAVHFDLESLDPLS